MIYVYGDESMDERCELACAVAGIIGTKEQWESLESRWTDRTCGIPFHANHCESDRGNYKTSSHSDNKNLYRDLTILLAESGLYGFGSVIDLAAYRVAFPLADPAIAADLNYLKGFMDVVEKMVEFAEDHSEIAEITFDNRTQIEHNAALLYANMRDLNLGWQSRLASRVIFESSQTNPRIQIADLFTREVMKGLVNDKATEKRLIRKSWQTLAATRRFVAYGYSTEWFADAVADLPNAADRLEFDPEGYRKWLGKRQPNNTAFIEYTRERFKKLTRKN